MKRNNMIYIIIFLALILIVSVQFLEPDLGNKISNLITILAAFTGLISVVYEMKKSTDVATSTYILELQKFFQGTSEVQSLYYKLDDYYLSRKNKITLKDRNEIVSYLTFLELLSTLVVKGTINIVDIDNIFSYNYFVCVNNPSVQKIELSEHKDYYQNTIIVYKEWLQYRKSRNKPIPLDDTPLL